MIPDSFHSLPWDRGKFEAAGWNFLFDVAIATLVPYACMT